MKAGLDQGLITLSEKEAKDLEFIFVKTAEENNETNKHRNSKKI